MILENRAGVYLNCFNSRSPICNPQNLAVAKIQKIAPKKYIIQLPAIPSKFVKKTERYLKNNDTLYLCSLFKQTNTVFLCKN